MTVLTQPLSRAFGGYRTIFGNRSLRRLQIAYASAIAAEWASTVAIGIVAYEAGGALAVGVVGLIRMLPSAAATPFAALVGDRYPRERVLLAIAVASAGTLALMAVLFFLGAPEIPLYALAGVLAVLATLTQPTISALMPSLARTPEELVAANGVAETTKSLGTLAGPVVAGVIVAAADSGAVFAAAAAMYAVAAVLLASISVVGRLHRTSAGEPTRIRSDLVAGLHVAVREPGPRLIIALIGAQALIRGALTVLIVVMAFRLFDSDGSWVGFLTAALGAGGLVGAFAALMLAGRRLARPLALGLVLWGPPIALIALWPNKLAALLLIAVVGVGNSIEDVSALTLLQRIVSDDVLSRVYGVFWGLAMAGAGVGSIIAPTVVSTLGPRGALVATGCVMPVLVALTWPRLVAIDRSASAPLRELDFLGGVPMFAPLSVAAKEHVAARLVPVSLPAGTEIIREGDRGDRFYIVVEGEAQVTSSGRSIARRAEGEYFGEIALLDAVPRAATVTATTDMELYALERDDFLTAVTGHSAGIAAGSAVVAERLANIRARAPADDVVAPAPPLE